MRILLYHPVLYPPRDYGGVERVVLWLSQGLRDLGHFVSIACAEGSRLPAGVHPLVVDPMLPIPKIPRLDGFDLIHFHSPIPSSEGLPIPYLVTIHGNGRPGEKYLPNTVFLSSDHARRHGRETFVWNGADPAEFAFRPKKNKDAKPLFLSKTSWKVKNLSGAMRICKKARTGLTIAGGHRPFGLRALSLLSGFDWAGPVAGARKAELLADASCLVFPVLWPEPFGLVMIESMLSGTPVIGSRLGSIPEVLGSAGGLLIDANAGDEAWGEALGKVSGFDPGAVREYALSRFTHVQMAQSYVSQYSKSIRGEKIR